MSLRIKPLTLKRANEVVAELHRHHKPVQGHRFSLGLYDDATLVGVVICGRPVARGCDPDTTLEVTRLVTDGTYNACSKLYGAAARVGKEMGFEKVQTYILESEDGTSLKASGWVKEADVVGRQWTHTDGKPRRTDQPNDNKTRWAKQLTPARPTV